MMHRNLDRRVEALVRVTDPAHLKDLLDFFDLAMDPGTTSWHLGADGVWTRHAEDAEGKPLIDLQDKTMGLIQRRRRARAVR
jgi:polyphosphate kinase